MVIKNQRKNNGREGWRGEYFSTLFHFFVFKVLVFSGCFIFFEKYFIMKENINIDIRKAEIVYFVRSKKLEELRTLVEAGKGSVEEVIKFQILQERIRESKVGRE